MIYYDIHYSTLTIIIYIEYPNTCIYYDIHYYDIHYYDIHYYDIQ